MNNVERLNLQKMINENDVKDETQNIRDKKHSSLIKEDVIRFVELKKNTLDYKRQILLNLKKYV